MFLIYIQSTTANSDKHELIFGSSPLSSWQHALRSLGEVGYTLENTDSSQEQCRWNLGAKWMTKTLDLPHQYRHGDVLIEELPSLPLVREKLQHTILAHGEVTGHCHRIKEADNADIYLTSEGLCLHVRGLTATVIHEEHSPITLTGGYYRVWRQREYSPEGIRVVRD